MAKGRMISGSISTSKKVAKLDDAGALIFTWLQSHTDDYGRMDGDALTVKAKVVPMRDYDEDHVEERLQKMHDLGLIFRYEVDGEKYLEVTDFNEHQTFRNDRPRRDLYPKPYTNGIPVVNQKDTKDVPMGEKRQPKLSQVKLSQANIVKGKKPFTTKIEGKILNELIDLFKNINPSVNRLFANKTQRQALDRLVVQHGEEKIRATIEYLPKSNGNRYAPTITTPVQLENNLGKLIAWGQKQKDFSSKGKKIRI